MQQDEWKSAGRNGAPVEPGPINNDDTAEEESLRLELRAAADAAIGHIQNVAATATAEAQLSAASAAAIAAAAIVSLVLLTISWICILALGIWFAVQAGWPVWLALVAALAVNLLGVLICKFWYSRLAANLGFARTRKLLVP